MERWRGRTVLITGASSAVGAAVACKLVYHGMKVIGSGRNVKKILALSNQLKEEDGMSFIQGGSLFPLKCDISKEENIIKMFQIIMELYGGVDVCIHCACAKMDASILQGNAAELKRMLEINVQASSIISREVVKSLASRGVDDGHIFYINSTASHLVPEDPGVHVLSMTQHACLAQAEALRLELRQMRSRIRTTTICPGKTKNDYVRRDGRSYQQNGEIIVDAFQVKQ
ncbi:dehydrogenase/reductase SDR family member 11-like [Lineus longissimus]|uniref:dehydrogenase/reductase SDR family member 11-like n=1 Tax=Lineus longissimus TaxID=88925 RepID=UPI00315CEFD6